ncbi:small G protein signaling modulator 1-like isoform X2 [Durio zibethinus]|uniref:Small G protein signaling modulator 1-like isoform X2 n=1 Tax=Durio zibethinus TaxID=66656 RepID=A0A6P6A9G5_DURZI|nr:small G protein signaling modulator 1-like isoform X2 [Durio zibethinus]
MFCGEKRKQWSCAAGAGAVNIQRVGSIVRDIGDPCLSQFPIKVSKMLKPEKWQATFDNEGKVSGFQKALKLIILGGIDPSIRPEVWEFLLGCYALGSTADDRRQLRTARRERYNDLIKQCQTMHSSIGTGSLAYTVGSKVMDMRTSSKDGGKREAKVESRQASTDDTDKREKYSDLGNTCTDKSYADQRESSSDSAELISVRGNANTAAYDTCFISTSGPCGRCSSKIGGDCNRSEFITEYEFDFPPLPVTDLFKKSEDEKEFDADEEEYSAQYKLMFEDDNMHSFQINNNADLIMESNVSPSLSKSISHPYNCEIELLHCDSYEPVLRSNKVGYKTETVNRLRISDVPESPLVNATRSQEGTAHDERVSEWLWTLHRIVVDVVRTDGHLEFYEDTRNLARMSDILAVYAWVDPAIGYCQGMSDLLSPFVVLFEDNADAFWCFEMLIRRMRENFQMEGPTGVMKQLQALWHILEFADREMFAHLSNIGAESLHFAFPMLLVLFRRELSFSEALCMWEMMWAADFDESATCNLEELCLEALNVQLPIDSGAEMREENRENGNDGVKGGLQSKHSLSENGGIKSASTHHFCGLTRSFWSRNDHLQICSVVSSTRIGNDDLPVFCVAAILIMNRQKIIRQTRSIDDIIKIFNDKLLKIHVKRCIGAAIKLRKKYLYKVQERLESDKKYFQGSYRCKHLAMVGNLSQVRRA